MRHTLFPAAMLIAGISAGAAWAEELNVEGVGLTRDIPCNNQDVGIYGAENAITLTGTCGQIVVHGSGHKVTFEKGKSLAVSGIDNKIIGGAVGGLSVETAKNTVTATIIGEGDAPAEIEIAGAEHTVKLDLHSKAALSVGGVQQNVEWSLAKDAPEPDINAAGALHTIQKK